MLRAAAERLQREEEAGTHGGRPGDGGVDQPRIEARPRHAAARGRPRLGRRAPRVPEIDAERGRAATPTSAISAIDASGAGRLRRRDKRQGRGLHGLRGAAAAPAAASMSTTRSPASAWCRPMNHIGGLASVVAATRAVRRHQPVGDAPHEARHQQERRRQPDDQHAPAGASTPPATTARHGARELADRQDGAEAERAGAERRDRVRRDEAKPADEARRQERQHGRWMDHARRRVQGEQHDAGRGCPSTRAWRRRWCGAESAAGRESSRRARRARGCPRPRPRRAPARSSRPRRRRTCRRRRSPRSPPTSGRTSSRSARP